MGRRHQGNFQDAISDLFLDLVVTYTCLSCDNSLSRILLICAFHICDSPSEIQILDGALLVCGNQACKRSSEPLPSMLGPFLESGELSQKSEQNIRATVTNEARQGEKLCLPQNHLTPGLGNKSHKSVALRFLAFGLVLGLDELEYADRVYLRQRVKAQVCYF